MTHAPLEDPLARYRTQPPWEFLLTASRNSLQSYELSQLSHAANLRKEISQLLEAWVEENSAAMLARWLIEHQERPEAAKASNVALEPRGGPDGHTGSDNVFADYDASARQTHGRC